MTTAALVLPQLAILHELEAHLTDMRDSEAALARHGESTGVDAEDALADIRVQRAACLETLRSCEIHS
jgi:hypothetical protein